MAFMCIGAFSFPLLSITINIEICHNPLLVTALAPLKHNCNKNKSSNDTINRLILIMLNPLTVNVPLI